MATYYKKLLNNSSTPLIGAGDFYDFLIAPNRDLIVVDRNNPSASDMFANILSAKDNYKIINKKFHTIIRNTVQNFKFALAPNNRDIFVIKYRGDSSVGLAILLASDNYSTNTTFHEIPVSINDSFSFFVLPSRDLVCILNKSRDPDVPIFQVEVHILLASSGYKTFSFQEKVGLFATEEMFDYSITFNGDLYAIKKIQTGTQTIEVHVLSAASGYKAFTTQTGTSLLNDDFNDSNTDYTYRVAPDGDLFAIKKLSLLGNNTTSGSNEITVLSSINTIKGVVKIHVKIVSPPKLQFELMFLNTVLVYLKQDIEIQLVSNEFLQPQLFLDNLFKLNLSPADLLKANVGTCTSTILPNSTSATEDQNRLFKYRKDPKTKKVIGSDEIVIYFVSNIVGTSPEGLKIVGCATYPKDMPGAVIDQNANKYTLAHEIGHVLGLFHEEDRSNIMFETVQDPGIELKLTTDQANIIISGVTMFNRPAIFKNVNDNN